jgi:hypothetical protein
MILYCFENSIAFSFCTDNIALYKPAWQLHPFNPEENSVTAIVDASNGVDGLKSDFRYEGGQCVISNNEEQIAAWRVDLGNILSIHHIIIYFRIENAAWGKLLSNSHLNCMYVNTLCLYILKIGDADRYFTLLHTLFYHLKS